MKKVLVTGGAGFIGSNFIHFALENMRDITIINLDALTYAGNLENLADLEGNTRYSFVHGDICNMECLTSIFTSNEINAVVHFAAESHVDRSIKNPMAFIMTNIVGTANLLNASLHAWERMKESQRSAFHFLHISTDEVFGSLGADDPPFTEQSAYAPNSPYAASKASADYLVRSYERTYGLPAIITNCSNNYGAYQYPEKFIPLIILNAIEGKPLPLYGDGGQIRDWLYVDDHCAALLKILANGKPGQSYNIGGNNQCTNLEIAHRICTILDELLPDSAHKPHEHLITFVKDRPGHDRRYAMDTTKIKRELEWEPHFELNEGLQRTVRWYLEHKNWVERVRSRPSYNDWIVQNYASREKETR